MAISKFQNFEFLTPKIPKADNFGKIYKIHFLEFWKENGVYVIEPYVYYISMPNFKEIHQYLVPQNLQNLCIPKFSITFFLIFRQLTKMKMVSLNLHWKAESNRSQF